MEKWKIIMEKMEHGKIVVKEGEINVNLSSIQGISNRFKKHGWDITYAVPVSELTDDPDTIIIETGR